MKSTSRSSGSQWLAADPSKGAFEQMILRYQPVWIAAIALVVATGIYEEWGRWGYLAFGIAVSTPPWLVPLLFPAKADEGRPLTECFWFKANVWIAIMSYIGNHFWTHYFYNVLGASYTFDAHRLNNVPFALYLVTHCYFCGYFVVSTILLRRVSRLASSYNSVLSRLIFSGFIVVLSLITAIGETVSISGFPHYRFKDRHAMLTLGTCFYALVFIPSFPMFYRIDENVQQKRGGSSKKMPLFQVVVESLATCMIVFLLFDFWRLLIGPIYQQQATSNNVPYA